MVTQPQNDLLACALEIQALSQLPSQDAMLSGLMEIASRYGDVSEIIPVSSQRHLASDHPIFLVNYKDTTAAIVAAHALKCHLFGFSTLLVSIHP